MGLLTRLHTELNSHRFDLDEVKAWLKRFEPLLAQAKSEAAKAAAVTSEMSRRFATKAVPVLREVADPRGRCNREAFLHIALAFLAVQFGVSAVLWLLGLDLGRAGAILLNGPILWIGTACCVKRLHDVGRRGWWIPGAFALWMAVALMISVLACLVLGGEALNEGTPTYFALFAVITLPAFGALIWLHTAPGMATSNQFGPVPGKTGLSMPPKQATAARSFFDSAALA